MSPHLYYADQDGDLHSDRLRELRARRTRLERGHFRPVPCHREPGDQRASAIISTGSQGDGGRERTCDSPAVRDGGPGRWERRHGGGYGDGGHEPFWVGAGTHHALRVCEVSGASPTTRTNLYRDNDFGNIGTALSLQSNYPHRIEEPCSGASLDVASAATVTLPSHSHFFNITGTTTITSVAATWAGHQVTPVLAGILTFTDGSNLVLNGNFVTSADDTITLVCNGTNWYEVGGARTSDVAHPAG